MKYLPLAGFVALIALNFPQAALAQRAQYDALVVTHARANAVPEALVHRVIVRESHYQPGLIGHGGTIGLMQIKLATARGLGYAGDAKGLLDADTNLTYGVKYLAGAYRAANGDHDRAIYYYARGYYETTKRRRLERAEYQRIKNSGNPVPAPDGTTPKKIGKMSATPHTSQIPINQDDANP